MKTTTPTHPVALRLLAALFFFCLLAPMAAGQDASTTPTYWKDQISDVDKIVNDKGGDGNTQATPILIATAEELAYFAQQVNKGEAITYGSDSVIEPTDGNDGKAGGFINYYFALSADIDLSKHFWTPIGINIKPFKGHFDGRGHCVSGLKVNVNVNQEGVYAYAGLFGNADAATIQNLGVRLAEAGIRAHATNTISYAGGIAGMAKNIHNCYVGGPGTVEAYATSINDPNSKLSSYAGGIVGSFLSSLTHCYAMVDVKAEGGAFNYAGGIAGSIRRSASLSYTYATGAVEAAGNTANNYAGGICGYAYNGSSLLNNLALNKSIKGKEGESNRIVGNKESNVTLTTNYASPEIQVNGSVVDGGTGTNENGDPSITFNNLKKTLGNEWQTAWTFPDGGYLPQLKLKSGDDWPEASPQPFIDPVAFLPGSITNADNRDGLSWKTAIQIANRAELAYFAQQVNSNQPITLSNSNNPINPADKGGNGFKGYYFALSTNIPLSGYYWTPIGTKDYPFNGNFDGNGHLVTELKVKIETSEDVYAGLFGYADFGTLRNLGVSLAKEGILGKSTGGNVEAGALAGRANNISNCYVVGIGGVEAQGASLSSSVSSAGGIVGYLTHTLTHCYATVGVKATGAENCYAGGIAAQCGSASCNLSYTYATGTVEAAGSTEKNYAGGICGDDGAGTLSNNLALNTSISGSREKIHRIVGNNNKNATLSSNYASTKIDLNGSIEITDDITADKCNGADTWIETFKEDLIPDPDDTNNGWVAAWKWPQDGSDNLPQLKKVGNDGSFSDGVLTGQSDIIITSVLTESKESPFILGAHIANGNPVYLAYDNNQWLRNIQGSVDTTPTFPFNGTVKGTGNNATSPVTIIQTVSGVSDAVPTLIFDKVNLLLNAGTCLTVNEGVKVILKMNNFNCMENRSSSSDIPAIANAGTLTINTEETNKLQVISVNSYAIRSSGTLTLEGNGLILIGNESAIFNKDNANVIYKNPMIEWQFASSLGNKFINWFNYPITLSEGDANCRSLATTYVPPVGQSLGLEVASVKPDSPYILQQGRDAADNYTTDFTVQDGQLTVYTDVKDCPRLHLLQPEGGTLTVTDTKETPLSDGDYVTTGTQLILSCSLEDNYDLVGYRSGTAADNLTALSGNEVTIGDADIWLSASLRYNDPTPPPPPPPPAPVYHSVYLPQIEGATLDPGPGEYEVESGNTFRFYLTLDSAYSESQPIVTTDRGETLVPRTSDGAYLVKYVCSDVEVFIDGIVQNPPPVANEAIAPADALVPQIWAEGSMLCIRMPEALPATPITIYTIDGRLHDSFASTPGLNRRQLPTGMYIVRIGETVRKVVIRK